MGRLLPGACQTACRCNNERIFKAAMKSGKFEVLVASDTDYDELLVEMYYDGQYVAHLRHDSESGSAKIEFPPPENIVNKSMICRSIDLDVFEELLELAKKRL